MKAEDFSASIQEYREIIEEQPDYPSQTIESTAKTLEDLSFSFTLGDMDVDLFRLDKKGFLNLLEKIEDLSVSAIEDSPTIFDPPQNHSPSLEDWARNAKARRIEVLLEKFLFLQRLRQDDPEAWDEVNELFYDD